MRMKKFAAAVLLLMFGAGAANALTNNTTSLELSPNTPVLPSNPIILVQHAKVTVMWTDFWTTDAIVWQLTTTDTNNWTHNECSANYPNHANTIVFSADDVNTSPDQNDPNGNKLQKLVSMLQMAQLTGMQVTIYGNSVSNPVDPGNDCVVTNILYVQLSNTTY